MARAADAVVLENKAAELDRLAPSVNQLSLLDDDLVGSSACPPPLAPLQAVSAVSRSGGAVGGAVGGGSSSSASKKPDNLCLNHARWGKDTYRCLKPSSCRMRRVVRPKPPQQQTPSGNAPAGSRQ